MLFEDIKKEEYNAGKADGFAEGISRGETLGELNATLKILLSFLGDKILVPDELKEKLKEIKDINVLNKLVKISASIGTLAEFEEALNKELNNN